MSHRTEMKRRSIDLDRKIREQLEGEFQREFFESAVDLDPCNIECLSQLGDLYTRQGEFEKGLAIDRRLVGLCPGESTFHYNLACSLALLERIDEAMETLREAIARGYDDRDHLERDEDLARLRGLPEFEALIEMIEEDEATPEPPSEPGI